MAIDSQDKRCSALGRLSFRLFPVADGTIGDADRWHAAGIYRGIAIGSSYTWTHALNGQRYFEYEAAIHGSDQLFADAFVKATADSVYLRVWDDTASGAVGEAVSTDSATVVRLKTAEVTLVDGHKYYVEFGVATGVGSGEVAGPYGFWDTN